MSQNADAYDCGVHTADLDEIDRTLNTLLWDRAIAEMRALGAERCGTISGYFDRDHREEMADVCAEWSGQAEGVYITLNPVREDLLARAANRERTWAKHTTSDADILCRRWLPLDFDPVRPAGISSTDAEHEAALDRARECKSWLRSLGVPPLSLVLADSGNGAHLLVRVNLPNDDPSQELIIRGSEAVAFRFSDEVVKVDLKTSNAARIWKVYGTLAAKGDSIPERPHRLARLLEVPRAIRPMKRRLIEELAAMAPEEPQPRAGEYKPWRGGGGFDLRQWIAAHNLPVVAEKPWKDGTVWILSPCPWNSGHSNQSAFIIQHASGAISAACHHKSCEGKGWHELRDVFEPGWRERRQGAKRVQVSEGTPPAIAREYERAVKHRSGKRKRQ